MIDEARARTDPPLAGRGSRPRAARLVREVAVWLGEASTYGRLWVALALLIRFVSPERGKVLARTTLKAVIAAWITSHAVVKPFVDRTRPADRETGESSSGSDESSSSFPSSHTATGAAFAASAYRCDRMVGLAMAPVVGLVGYSRVLTDAHHASDVLAGGAIGAVVGFWVGEPR